MRRLGWLLGILLLTACERRPAAPADQTLTVHAAASLRNAFQTIARDFERARPGVRITLNTAGSNQLRLQLEQGAPGDVFASADSVQMDAAIASGLCDRADARVFAHNTLVIITPAHGARAIERFADLAHPDRRLLIAEPAVPVGRYTERLLDTAGGHALFGPDFVARVRANVASREHSVAAIVAKIRLAEADAGLAYASDATGLAADELRVIALPDDLAQRADYLIAPVTRSTQPDLARAFVAFVLRNARGTLRDAGFSTPTSP
ncbi:MAG: molybdate ABC transporter substrate-binding protein [Phycisphaerales bacterium]